MKRYIDIENARLSFTISHNQFVNERIPAKVYFERLEILSSLINKSSALYQILKDILSTPNDQQKVCTDKQNAVQLGDNYEAICNLAQQEGGAIQFIRPQDIRITDPDPLPSLPHIHDFANNRKIDVYTGKGTDGSNIPRKELIALWNNPDFIERIKKNRTTIETL